MPNLHALPILAIREKKTDSYNPVDAYLLLMLNLKICDYVTMAWNFYEEYTIRMIFSSSSLPYVHFSR